MSQAPLPTPTPSTVDIKNVQGDIITGLPKKKEEFVFFVIKNAAQFQRALPNLKIASHADVIHCRQEISKARRLDPSAVIAAPLLNIAFSQHGLDALGITDDIGDIAFKNGQLADAQTLGDEGVTHDGKFDPTWEHAFKGRVDGVLLAAGESWGTVKGVVKDALDILGGSVRVVYRLKGSVRPKEEKGHEHFGWLDGISNPAIKDIVDPLPGQRVIPPGVLLLGKDKDPVATRPSWAVEGSFLVFRQLGQLVPEFSDFLNQNPILEAGDRKLGSELLGARLVGRWKSGAPIQLAPTADDPELGKDPLRNNHFIYPQDAGEEGQTACPYAAHVRKTNPRNDLDAADTDNTSPGNPVTGLSIARAGIPYGPEVTPLEQVEKLTEHERGLAFVSYQSALQIGPDTSAFNSLGFRFIQRSWANNVDFPPKQTEGGDKLSAGFDPIVGQANGQPRETLGTSSGPKLSMPRDFVVSKGGEYFFSPSIHALKTRFAGVTA